MHIFSVSWGIKPYNELDHGITTDVRNVFCFHTATLIQSVVNKIEVPEYNL